MEMKEDNGLLSSKETSQVSGGADEKHTLMHCEECEYETVWIGDFMDELPHPCECCGELAMYGIRYI